MTPCSLLAVVVLTLMTLGAAGAPAAGAAWTAPVQIVPDAAASNVSGAGNRHGSEAFAWVVTSKRLVRAAGMGGFASRVRARVRLPDGRLGRVQTISSAGGLVRSPRVGVDASGNVTAVWTQAGRHLSIMAAFRPHGRAFGRPVELGRSQHFNDARPQLAVGRFGDAVVAWNHGRSVQVVRRGPPLCVAQRARACFTAPLRLRSGSDQTVAIGPLGSAYVVWAAVLRTAAGEVRTRLRLAVLRRSGRRLGTEHFLAGTGTGAGAGDASQPSLDVAPDGTAVVAWRASPPAGGEQDEAAPILAAASSPDAVTAPARAVSTAAGSLPQVRLNARGEALLAWNELISTPDNPDGAGVAVAIRSPGAAAFGAPARISPPTIASDGAALAVDAAGTAFLLYSADSTAGRRVAVSHVRVPGGIFGSPTTLPPAFAGGTLLAAGAKVTAVSGPIGSTAVSDWVPQPQPRDARSRRGRPPLRSASRPRRRAGRA